MSKTEVVKKSNALIEAAYHPASLYQMRLLLVAISQIKDSENLTYKTQFEISAQGVADLIGIAGKSGGHYYQLKKAADDLMEMIVTVKKNPDGRPRSKRWSRINVVNECVYCEGEAKVILTFTPSIIPYIAALEGRYKAYKLAHVIRMKSKYGIRLYELCLQWVFPNGWKEITVDEFRYLMGLEDKYRVIADMKKWVIQPALRDIKTCSDLSVTCRTRKVGRIITYLQFKITKKLVEARIPTRTAERRRRVDNSPQAPGIAIPYLEAPDWQARRFYVEENIGPDEDWTKAKERLTNELQKGIIREKGKIIEETP